MKKRVLSALLALCLTLSLAGAAFAENEPSGDSSSAVSQAVSSVESEPQTQDETVSSGSVSGEDQTAAKTESTPAPTETPAASDVAEEEPESTPEPEAATEPDTTPAPTEDPVADVTENEESDGSVEYTAALETDGETMNVIVTAPEGAFAEGVQPKLRVTMLTAEDELNAVADKLKNAEVQYDGFTALDITFTDKATGEEVEPVKSVAVRIELPQTIVDSGIDLSTLAVQHLEEDENGNVQNVTEVATLDNGITLSEEAAAAANEAAGVAPMSDMPAEEATAGDAAETPAAVAEFDVDGFSSFVITWQKWEGVLFWGTWKDVAETKFIIIDAETGEELLGTDHINKFDKEVQGTEAEVGQLAPYVQDYTFKKVVVAHNSVEAVGDSATDTAKLRISQSDQYNLQYCVTGGWESWYNVGTDRKVYFLYSKDTVGSAGTGGGSVEIDLPQPAISKQANSNGDGTYELSLSVSGSTGSQTSTANVNVLMIVDESNSMTKNYSPRLSNAKEAMRSLVKSLEKQDNVTAQYSIVGFGSDWTLELDWNSINEWYDPDTEAEFDRTIVGQAIDDINSSGGTNYHAGIEQAKRQLEKVAGEKAISVVVFLSDGQPNYYYDADGKRAGGGSGELGTSSEGWRYTLEAADGLYCNQFYAVAFSKSYEKYLNTNEAYGGLCDVVHSTNPPVFVADDNDQGTNLANIFGNIAGSVTDIYIENVTINDIVDTQNVEQVPNTELEVIISDGNPATEDEQITNAEVAAGNISATYTDGLLRLDFDDTYQLKPGYTYTVTMQIEPTEWAKTEYADQNYPDTATAGWDTGTHSYSTGDKGIFSNVEATLNYEYTENEEGTVAEPLTYPMPVIQVPEIKAGDLTITKKVEWTNQGEKTSVTGKQFQFTITTITNVTGEQPDGGYSILVNGEESRDKADFTLNGDGIYSATVSVYGEGSVKIQDLPFATYTVKETNAPDMGDFYCASTRYGDQAAATEASLTLDKEHTEKSVTVTNTYAKYRTVMVIKDVTGEMGDTSRFFEFTAKIGEENVPQANIQAVDTNPQTAQVTGAGKFKLKDDGTHQGSVNIVKVRQDAPLTITETSVANEGYTTKYTINESTQQGNIARVTSEMLGEGNVTVKFENYRPVVAPTGLEDNHTKPFGLMVGVAVMAGLALAGGAVVRRRRRWME